MGECLGSHPIHVCLVLVLVRVYRHTSRRVISKSHTYLSYSSASSHLNTHSHTHTHTHKHTHTSMYICPPLRHHDAACLSLSSPRSSPSIIIQQIKWHAHPYVLVHSLVCNSTLRVHLCACVRGVCVCRRTESLGRRKHPLSSERQYVHDRTQSLRSGSSLLLSDSLER